MYYLTRTTRLFVPTQPPPPTPQSTPTPLPRAPPPSEACRKRTWMNGRRLKKKKKKDMLSVLFADIPSRCCEGGYRVHVVKRKPVKKKEGWTTAGSWCMRLKEWERVEMEYLDECAKKKMPMFQQGLRLLTWRKRSWVMHRILDGRSWVMHMKINETGLVAGGGGGLRW